MIDKHASLAEKFLKKGFWLYLFSFIIAPIGYIIKIIISNDLSVSEVWILYWVISIVTLLSAFSDFWIRESLSYFIPRFEEEKRPDRVKSLLVFWFVIQIITGLIIFSLLFFWADFIAQSYFKNSSAIEILKVFSFFFLWINLFQLINNFFMAVQNTFFQKVTELIRMTFVMLGVISIYFLDIWWLLLYSYSWIWWLYLGVVISLVIFYIKYYKTYMSWCDVLIEKKLMKEIFVYASLTFFSTQSFVILSQIDMQMVLAMLWSENAWYYTNYLSIVWIPNIILWPVFFLFYPVISQLHAQKEHTKIKNIKDVFQKNFVIITLYFSVLFFVFALPIAYILFGEKFLTSWFILQFSVLFIVWNFLLRLNQIILAATWRVKERLYIVITSIVINIILNFLLITYMWVTGAALATGISWIIIWALTEFLLKKYYCRFDYVNILKNISILGWFWYILHIYFLPFFNDQTRLFSLYILSGITIIYFWLFLALNLKKLKVVKKEIKNLKN